MDALERDYFLLVMLTQRLGEAVAREDEAEIHKILRQRESFLDNLRRRDRNASPQTQARIHGLLKDAIAAEQANIRALKSRMEDVGTRMKELAAARRQLARLKQGYGPKRNNLARVMNEVY